MSKKMSTPSARWNQLVKSPSTRRVVQRFHRLRLTLIRFNQPGLTIEFWESCSSRVAPCVEIEGNEVIEGNRICYRVPGGFGVSQGLNVRRAKGGAAEYERARLEINETAWNLVRGEIRSAKWWPERIPGCGEKSKK